MMQELKQQLFQAESLHPYRSCLLL